MKEEEDLKETEKAMLPLQHLEKVAVSDVEDFLFFGPYQVAVLIAYQVMTFTFAFNLLFMTFVGWEPSWDCQYLNQSSNIANWTYADRCERFDNGHCQNVTWKDVSFNSIVSEWNLICSSKFAVYLIITIQMVGLLLGAPLTTHMADFCGRKTALLTCIIGQTVFGIGTGFSHTWQVFAMCRFFVGLFGGGLISIAGVFLVETVNRNNRMIFMSIGGINMGFLLSAAVAFPFTRWDFLAIAASSVGFVAILIIGCASETLRWLIQHGKIDQAWKSYRYILRLNRKSHKEMSDSEWGALLNRLRQHTYRRRSFWHLFQTRKRCMKTVVLMYSTFALNVATTLLMLSMIDLAGSIYLNAMIFGVILWASAVTGGLIDRLWSVGRKRIICFLLSVVCACLAAMTVSKWLESGVYLLENVFLFAGTAATSPLWVSVSLTILESYPTSMRSIASGLASIFSNFGGVVAPQLLMTAQNWKPIPWIVLALMMLTFLVGFMAVVKETKGRPLPEESEGEDRKAPFVSKEA